MLLNGGQELLVFEVPQCLVPGPGCKESQIGNHLTKSKVWGQFTQVLELAENSKRFGLIMEARLSGPIVC